MLRTISLAIHTFCFGYNLFSLFTATATPLNAFLAVFFGFALLGHYITVPSKKQG